MKVDRLIDAIGAIAPEYVEEAELWDGTAEKRGRKLFGYARWRKILLPVSACLALVAVGSTAGLWYIGNGKFSSDSSGVYSGASTDSAADAGGSSGGTMSGGSGMSDSAAYDTGDEAEGEAQRENASMTQDAAADKNTSQTDITAGGELIVNEADAFSIAIADHAAPAYEKYYTVEDLEDYYGIRIMPGEIPYGLVLVGAGGETPYVIGYDENDAVMDDNCKLIFSDDGLGRELEIAARTMDVGEMRGFEGQNMEPSYLCGQEVTIACIGEEYLAIYEREGVTVTVWCRGLSGEELQIVLVGLLAEQ